VAYDVGRIASQYINQGQVNKEEWSALALDAGSMAIPGVVGLGTIRRVGQGLKVADKVADAGKVADKVGDAVNGVSEVKGFGKKLNYHFKKHASEFGTKTKEEYGQKAIDFIKNSDKPGILRKVDPEGVTRVYDPVNNILASYKSDGTIKTFFKPNPVNHPYKTNLEYWNAQKGGGL